MNANNPILGIRTLVVAALIAGVAWQAKLTHAATGMQITELEEIDELVQNFIDDNGVNGAIVGIMKDGVIIYQRGFGWADQAGTVPMSYSAVARVASVTKPVCAAVVHKLYEQEVLHPDDFVFDFGRPEGGVMDTKQYVPFPSLGDPAFEVMTIDHLLRHQSGLATNLIDDPMFKERQIAIEFNDAGEWSPFPPTKVKNVRWLMGQPLENPLGTSGYSNVGYMVLGAAVENATAEPLYDTIIEQIVEPMDWVPVNQVIAGKTLEPFHDPREPWYDSNGIEWFSAFEEEPTLVPVAYGGWSQEKAIAQTALVLGTTFMLNFANEYYLNGYDDGSIGTPLSTLEDPGRFHTGKVWGTSAMLSQRSDGINTAIIMNSSVNGDGSHASSLSAMMAQQYNEYQDNGLAWPTQGVDGDWLDLNYTESAQGTYEEPWVDMDQVLAVDDNTTINCKPGGDSPWIGTINKKIRFRMPEGNGSFRIGVIPE